MLIDLKMPMMNGIEATGQIVSRFPQTRMLVLTTYDADEWVFDTVRAGAAGYLIGVRLSSKTATGLFLRAGRRSYWCPRRESNPRMAV